MTHALLWSLTMLIAVWYGAVPIILAGTGGLVSEKSGISNIGLEGLLLLGAFVGIWAGGHNGLIGVIAAVVVGAAAGLCMAALIQEFGIDPIVCGLSLNMMAAGATQYLSVILYPDGITVPGLPRWPFLALALVLPGACLFALGHTRWGLRLRAAGEDSRAARMAGLDVKRIRYGGLALSGALAALGGAFLSLVDAHTFSSNMSAGKGYIALALVVFGGWNPVRVAGGALMFGLLYTLQTQVQINNWHAHVLGVQFFDPALLDTAPYVATILVLAVAARRVTAPRAVGQVDEGVGDSA
ncbi:MAG: ABC transporter permease [Capsulimonadaceae bacterium]